MVFKFEGFHIPEDSNDLLSTYIFFSTCHPYLKQNIMLKVYDDWSFSMEQMNVNSEFNISLEDLSNYTEDDLIAFHAAMAAGSSINLIVAPDYPSIKFPLSWIDESTGRIWFSGEMVVNKETGGFDSCTIFCAITNSFQFEMYVRNPATGELILQE